ncbi:urea transporter 1-like isoform X2 [Homarus americanus]|uniref:urea transporter 1-like isoform X2 n=1 Tax=Homarus americanus TaxID=6706 RepID=UPI001C45816B|nr:urea transporter 1-like isoform X2 [Homarus americanus]
MNNRRTEKPPVWLTWVGDMSAITKFLLAKPWLSPWCISKTANSILRAIGVVLSQPEQLISDGVVVFNGILVGCISVAVFPGITGHAIDASFWLFLTIVLIITAYVDRGLNALMAPCQLPALSIPFNFAAVLLLLSMRSAAGLTGTQLPPTPTNTTNSANSTIELDWSKVMEGTLLAAGQIYGVGTIDPSILIYLAFLLFSPVLTIFFYMGSVIGTIIGALVSAAPYTDVYIGLWGYNSMLTAGAVSYFVVPTPGVVLAAAVGATIAATVQAATLHIFSAMTVPVLSYPFNVATLLILAIAVTHDSPFSWVPEKTFPEYHLFLYVRSLRRCQNTVTSSEAPEELLQVNHK